MSSVEDIYSIGQSNVQEEAVIDEDKNETVYLIKIRIVENEQFKTGGEGGSR